MPSLLRDAAFERDALDYFPSPIADTLDEAVAESSNRAQRDKIVETFRVALRIVGLFALAATPATPPSTAELLKKLLRQGLTDGEWVGLARELTRPYAGAPQECGVPELVAMFFDRGGRLQPTFAQGGPCDSLLAMRKSDTVAHGISGSEETAADVITGRLADFEAFLRSLQWMWANPLVMPTSRSVSDSGEPAYATLRFVGVTPRRGFRSDTLTVSSDLGLGLVYVTPQQGQPVALHPFVQYAETGLGQREIFLFEEGGKRDATLRAYPAGQKRQDAEALVEARARFIAQPAKSGQRQVPGIDWTLSAVATAAKRSSEDYLEKMQRERIFLPTLYARRLELERHLAGFLEKTCVRTGLMIVGSSGIGKTNTLCHIVSNWFSDSTGLADDIVLFVGGSTLPGGRFSLRDLILDRLQITQTFPRFLDEFDALRSGSQTQLILVVDGVDKHVDSAELLRQIDDIVRTADRHTWLKVIASIGEVAYGAIRSAGFIPSVRSYYSATVGEQPHSRESPLITLGPLTDTELADAYGNYLRETGFRPTTPFDSVSEEMRNALRNPLYLRIVMEVFDGRAVPRRPMTAEVLLEYCSKKVFSRPDRSYFVNRFVDMLYDNRLAAAKFDVLAHDTDLRQMVLDPSPQSAFLQLLDDQVLEEQVKRVSAILPPHRSVAFTYDRLLEYLLLNRIVERFGLSSEVLTRLSIEAETYLPLRGVLATLLLAKLDEGAYQEVCDLIRGGQRDVMRAVAITVLMDLDQATPGDTPPRDPPRFERLVDDLLHSPDADAIDLLLECGEKLADAGAFRRADTLYERFLARPVEMSTTATARLCRGAGRVRSVLGLRDSAMEAFTKALGSFRATNDRDGEQGVCDDIGREYLLSGEPLMALRWFEESLAIDEELVNLRRPGALAGKANSLLNIAAAHQQLGNVAMAVTCAKDAAAWLEEAGEQTGLATALTQLGILYRRQGLVELARAEQQRALSLHQQAGDKLGIAKDLQSIAATYRVQASWAEAEAHCRRAMRVYEELGHRRGLAATWISLGEIQRATEQLDDALDSYGQALLLFNEAASRGGQARCESNLGATHIMKGELDEAVRHLDRAIELQGEILGVGRAHPETLALKAGAMFEVGNKEMAVDLSDKSVAAMSTGRFTEEDVRTVYWHRYRVLAGVGRDAEARDCLELAYRDLVTDAEKISDQTARRGFLESLPIRRAITAAWGATFPES